MVWASSAGAGWSRMASLMCLTIDKLVGLQGVAGGIGGGLFLFCQANH